MDESFIITPAVGAWLVIVILGGLAALPLCWVGLVLVCRGVRTGIKRAAMVGAVDTLGGIRFRVRGLPARISVVDNTVRVAIYVDVDLRRLPLAPAGMSLRLYGRSVLASMPCPWLGGSIVEFVRQAAAVALEVRARRVSKCPICGNAVGDEAIECAECMTPHHEDCWIYNGGMCAIYGCAGASISDHGVRAPRSGCRPRRRA
jgi:hypothetical protein